MLRSSWYHRYGRFLREVKFGTRTYCRFLLLRLSHFLRKWNGSVHCDIISLFFLFRRFLVLILFVSFSLCFFQSSGAMFFQNSLVSFFLTVQRLYPCQKRCLLISSHGSSKLADEACKIRLNWFGKMPRRLRPCSWRFARSISLATSWGIPQSRKNFLLLYVRTFTK